MKILKNEGCGADCSSLPELILAENAGMQGEEVMFTSNETPSKEYIYANLKGNIINLDDITHIDFLDATLGGLPELISFRYNPGPLKAGNALIGKPEEAKYGLTREQIFEAYKICKDRGVKRFGLHTMVASNELNPDYFVETAQLLFTLAVELKEKVGVAVEFVNLGGGIGIPYRPEQVAVDYDYVAKGDAEALNMARLAGGSVLELRELINGATDEARTQSFELFTRLMARSIQGGWILQVRFARNKREAEAVLAIRMPRRKTPIQARNQQRKKAKNRGSLDCMRSLRTTPRRAYLKRSLKNQAIS